ncbi:retrotrans_gag domain-containing protein [Trichonephila clavipes]|nr:retrotrans_gag domain-containing protein [Trichonephila clavipes]
MALLLLLLCSVASAAPLAKHMVDMTYTFDETTLNYPGVKKFEINTVQNGMTDEGFWSLRLRGLSPEFGLLKENSRKRTKMPTEQEAKPAVVTPSLQQWRSPSTFRGAPGEDPLKWLKEYDRVANFNKWDDMMCLANVYFFLDGTARQWYVNNEDALDSWGAFKNGLSGLFGDRQKYTREGQKNN